MRLFTSPHLPLFPAFQVRYLGLLENLRVRRAGYAFRMEFQRFIDRYKMLSKLTWPVFKGSPHDGICYILEEGADLSKAEYAFGRSKVFVRNPRSVLKLEDQRRAMTIVLATKIQAIFKGWKARSQYKKIRGAQLTISSHYRGFKAKRAYTETRNGIILITAYWRMWKERKQLAIHMQRLAMAKAQMLIAAHVKGWLVRKRMAKHFRKNAGPTLYRTLCVFQIKTWLRRAAKTLPPMAPNAKNSLRAPPKLLHASELIKEFFHEYRCKVYRDRLRPAQRDALRLKLLASNLFKGKKAIYPASVPEPFLGDHASLLDDSDTAAKWKKVAAAHSFDAADVHMTTKVTKMNRSNRATMPRVLVLMSSRLLILDEKLKFKYEIPLGEMAKASTSSQGDDLMVLHVAISQENKALSKGDHMFYCPQ